MKLVKDMSFLIIVGVILGIIITFSLGGIFLSLAIVISGYLIWRNAEREDRKFLTYLFISGIAVRIIIYCSYTYFSILSGKGGWLIGDAYGFYNYAWLYAQKVEGSRNFLINGLNDGMVYDVSRYFYKYYGNSYERIINSFSYGGYGFNGFTMLLAYLFCIFGPMKFSGRLINILFGALNGIFIYYIAKRIFGKKSAKIAAVLATFFPSMFIWSLDFLKDPLYILMTTILFWASIKYWDTKKFLYIVLIFVAVFIQNTLRKDLSIIGLIPFALGILLFLRSKLIKKIIFIAVIGIAAVFFMNKGINYTFIRHTALLAIGKHIGHVNTCYASGGYSYKLLDDKYYIPVSYNSNNITMHEILKAFLKGWWYFLFAPFVWDIKSKPMLMALPQMMLWYMLLIFAMVGIIFGLRYCNKRKYIILMLGYIFLLSLPIALSNGNVGTLFRQRDIVTSFYLICSAVGISHLLKISKRPCQPEFK